MSITCPFCNIALGKAEASIVYEDEIVLAFMDLSPAVEGHTLVVPRGHWENIYEVPDAVLADVAVVVKRVCVAAKKAVGADGVKVIQLNGRAAGQVVFHLHFHIIPVRAWEGTVIGHHGRTRYDRKMLDEAAKKIRENL